MMGDRAGKPESRLQVWLQRTHSPQFELCRHFFLQFFESEFVATPGQLKLLAGGVFSLIASLCVLFLPSYFHKYRMLRQIDDPTPYQQALLADVLFLILLTMWVTTLVTTLEWSNLFPSRRDLLALGGLPVRMDQIFAAKFASLTGFMFGVIVALALPPSSGLPWMMTPPRNFILHREALGTMFWYVPGMFLGCLAGGLFVFFVLITLQGVLLNVLPLKLSGRITGTIQMGLMLVLLSLAPAVLSAPRLAPHMLERPEWIQWAPPAWFLAVSQIIAGNREPVAMRLAGIAVASLAVAAISAVAAYWWTYRDHRVRVLESSASTSSVSQGPASRIAAEGWIRDARTLAIFDFTAKTLMRSHQHRLILTGYAGAALAIILTLAAYSTFLSRDGAYGIQRVAIAMPLALSLFTIGGLKYLFRLPVELRANWLFRIHEPGSAPSLIAGLEAYLILFGLMPPMVASLPLEFYAYGAWRGACVAILCALPGVVLVETVLFMDAKIPFTSSYLPGKRMMVEVVLIYGTTLVLYVTILGTLIRWCAETGARSLLYAGLVLGCWWYLRHARLAAQAMCRLEFEETMEPAVQTIDIDRD